jgi:hypothetical protein
MLLALEAGDSETKLLPAFERLSRPLTDPDPSIRLQAEELVLGLFYWNGRQGDAEDVREITIRYANHWRDERRRPSPSPISLTVE